MKIRNFLFLLPLIFYSCMDGGMGVEAEKADSISNDSLAQEDSAHIEEGGIVNDSAGHGHEFEDSVSVQKELNREQIGQPLDQERKQVRQNVREK